MNDDELLDALRTARMAADPAPSNLRADAIAARFWRATDETLTLEQMLDPPVVMRGDDARDLHFTGHGYEVHVTIDAAVEPIVLHGFIRPAVESITVLVPGGIPRRAPCTTSGQFSVDVSGSHIAIGFGTGDGTTVSTPLIDL